MRVLFERQEKDKISQLRSVGTARDQFQFFDQFSDSQPQLMRVNDSSEFVTLLLPLGRDGQKVIVLRYSDSVQFSRTSQQ